MPGPLTGTRVVELAGLGPCPHAAMLLADPATRAHILARIPLGRVAEPEDVVGPTLFFCSPAASFVTGQILTLDGGLTATQ